MQQSEHSGRGSLFLVFPWDRLGPLMTGDSGVVEISCQLLIPSFYLIFKDEDLSFLSL